MQTILEIKNLTKKYGKKIILDNINLKIYRKERVAIVGANGAGKSTLVDIIAGSTNKTQGEINYNLNNSILKKAIGIQYQESNWPSGISAKDVINFNRKLKNKLTNLDQLLEIFEINEFIKVPLEKVSGGQKQRFNALLSVISNPELLILDELSSGLDMHIQFKIIDFLKSYFHNNSKTLLIISHNSEEIELLANRLIVLENGKIFIDKPVKEIINTWGSIRNFMIKFFKGELKNELF